MPEVALLRPVKDAILAAQVASPALAAGATAGVAGAMTKIIFLREST
jgi:hypothetical protein